MIDVSEHNRRVRVSVRAIRAAIADAEDQAADVLMEMAAGDDDGADQWRRLSTGVYAWIQMCKHAGEHLGIADLSASLPHDPDLPPEVRGAAHLFNLGLAGQWREAGEVLGAAIAADTGYETVTQVLWVCGNLLRRLRMVPPPAPGTP